MDGSSIHTRSLINVAADDSDEKLVARIRLLLAVSAFLSVIVDHEEFGAIPSSSLLVFPGYIFHSLVIVALSYVSNPFTHGKLSHWIDVAWYALVIAVTGGIDSFFFLFFFFAIINASFRWGVDEGARVTVASTVLFAVCGFWTATEDETGRLLMRTTFLLSLGYMCVYWGGFKVELKRRLMLLRDVSSFSNPRFGVRHTTINVLQKTAEFFSGGCCLLIIHDKETDCYVLNKVNLGKGVPCASHSEEISADGALPFLALPEGRICLYARPLAPVLSRFGGAHSCKTESSTWRREPEPPSEYLAELLDSRSFISAPLFSAKGDGRIYVFSRDYRFGKSDALFLSQIGAQVFPIIQTIELLDRLASRAASEERQKFALNLHDTAIQPYIGLKMALGALLQKATADNPLRSDISTLTDTTAKVIDDLRRYAGDFKNGASITEQVLIKILGRHSMQIQELYGVTIDVRVDGNLPVGDRLTAEILQIVNEGMSNICKHTHAQRGAVTIGVQGSRVVIRIENDSPENGSVEFLPRSINERATALGGSTRVDHGLNGRTVVNVFIPI